MVVSGRLLPEQDSLHRHFLDLGTRETLGELLDDLLDDLLADVMSIAERLDEVPLIRVQVTRRTNDLAHTFDPSSRMEAQNS
jgi:hypothetical protein